MRQQFMMIPVTTNSVIVFRYDRFRKCFDLSQYAPIMTDGLLYEKELQEYMEKINSIVEKGRPNTRKLCWFITAFVIVIVSVSIIIPVTTVSSKNTNFGLTFGLSFGLTFGCFVCFLLYLIRFSLDWQKKTTQMINEAKEYVKSKQQEFEARGLRWAIPSGFPAWIELWKDYKSNNVVVYDNEPIDQGEPLDPHIKSMSSSPLNPQYNYGENPYEVFQNEQSFNASFQQQN